MIVNCKQCGHLLQRKEKLRNWQAGKPYTWYLTLYIMLNAYCPNCQRPLPDPEKFADEMKLKITAYDIMRSKLVVEVIE